MVMANQIGIAVKGLMVILMNMMKLVSRFITRMNYRSIVLRCYSKESAQLQLGLLGFIFIVILEHLELVASPMLNYDMFAELIFLQFLILDLSWLISMTPAGLS
jgi:hypothetical protein